MSDIAAIRERAMERTIKLDLSYGRERFDIVFDEMLSIGPRVYVDVFVGASDDTDFHPATTTQAVPLEHCKWIAHPHPDERGLKTGLITLNLSPSAVGNMTWHEETQTYLVDLTFQGKNQTVAFSPLMVLSVYNGDNLDEYIPIATMQELGGRARYSESGVFMGFICPIELSKACLKPAEEPDPKPAGKVVSFPSPKQVH